MLCKNWNNFYCFKENDNDLLCFFIDEKLKELILPLATRFIGMEVLKEHKFAKFIKLDFDESTHLLPSFPVDSSFAANTVLKKLGTLENAKECQFKRNVKTFFQNFCQSLQKNQVCINTASHLFSLPPTQISSISDELLFKRFKKLLKTLFDLLLISAKVADHAKV